MAKGKRVSCKWNPAFYCKVDKEILHMIRTRHMLGLKKIVISLPTYHNEHKRGKVRQLPLGNNRVSAEMTTNNFKLIKQGQLIEWTFDVYG